MRSSQVDAARLDEELTLMLREQFMKVFSLFQPVRHSKVERSMQSPHGDAKHPPPTNTPRCALCPASFRLRRALWRGCSQS
jgi:hypothetical protein